MFSCSWYFSQLTAKFFLILSNLAFEFGLALGLFFNLFSIFSTVFLTFSGDNSVKSEGVGSGSLSSESAIELAYSHIASNCFAIFSLFVFIALPQTKVYLPATDSIFVPSVLTSLSQFGIAALSSEV